MIRIRVRVVVTIVCVVMVIVFYLFCYYSSCYIFSLIHVVEQPLRNHIQGIVRVSDTDLCDRGEVDVIVSSHVGIVINERSDRMTMISFPLSARLFL